MKRSLLFAILGVIVIIMFVGVVAVNLKKSTVSAAPSTPVAVQTSAAAKDEPSQTPTAEESSDEQEVDMSDYKPHKLPENIDDWTPEEWEWYTTVAVQFQQDYRDTFYNSFGEDPPEKAVSVASDFAEEVCSKFDDGATVDDIAAAIVDAGSNKKTQAALALAVKPGVENFCPWNSGKLK